jgi:glyoxylase-like metal-dependent hydrolase (beta-lactamase superfamily II)
MLARASGFATGATASSRSRNIAERHIGDQSAKFTSVEPDLSLEDGERILHGRFDLAVIHTPGHTPGSVCLHDQTTGTLFTGDTLFARSMYSPTLRPFSSADPMTEYLTSIDSLSRLDVTVGLPGHGDPIQNVLTQCASAADHHLNRSAEVLRLVDTGGSAWEIAARLPRRRGWNTLGLGPRLSATGEVSAHLVRLKGQGNVAEGVDGATAVWRAN